MSCYLLKVYLKACRGSAARDMHMAGGGADKTGARGACGAARIVIIIIMIIIMIIVMIMIIVIIVMIIQ